MPGHAGAGSISAHPAPDAKAEKAALPRSRRTAVQARLALRFGAAGSSERTPLTGCSDLRCGRVVQRRGHSRRRQKLHQWVINSEQRTMKQPVEEWLVGRVAGDVAEACCCLEVSARAVAARLQATAIGLLNVGSYVHGRANRQNTGAFRQAFGSERLRH